eukprot:TRINITY_DN400_c0_g1_i2.p1 TRINITY_DN400_c0_g1~~TRINITY_DN400_c0_g1_i2.p1  ORF type:complete len:232 (+),score=46.14 TRINITY_DN400_c0_g1_i2:63-758(+)
MSEAKEQQKKDEARARREKADRDSSKMAEKLLLGWCMLNDYCSKNGCAVPLLRDRSGGIYCVSCDSYVNKNQPEPIAPAKETKVAKTESKQENTAKPVEKASDTTADDFSFTLLPKTTASSLAAGVRSVFATSRTSTSAPIQSNQPSIVPASLPDQPQQIPTSGIPHTYILTDPNHIQVIENTIAGLITKIQECSVELARTPVNNPTTCIQLTNLMRECSTSVKELQSLLY